jgi:integrase
VRSGWPDSPRFLVPARADLSLASVSLLGVIAIDLLVVEVGNRLVYALPKGRKNRVVPVPSSVSLALTRHLEQFPPVSVALPWEIPGGPVATVNLIVHSRTNVAMDRHTFNRDYWHAALASAGIERTRATGMHALRHFYASVLPDAGESVKALSEYLGHADPGFTLRTYTHLMPSSEERTRRAIDQVLSQSAHGLGTVHA